MSSPTVGFWGPSTSTVDWCETNYQHLFHVGELFNTASSLVLVLVGILGLALHRRVLERRFLLAFALLSVVGIGSTAFHATLLREFQMLDELPMLYLAIVIVYILLENRPQRRFGTWLPLLLLGHAVLVTYLTAFTRGTAQFFLFQVSFASLEFYALGRTYVLQRRSPDVKVKRLFRLGIAAYALAIVLWLSDIQFCPTLNETLPANGVPNPQFHAWWHVLVSCGFYALLLVIAHDRLGILERQPRLGAVAGGIPRVLGNIPTPGVKADPYSDATSIPSG
ncbi:ceramidase [Pyxidicoccus parkwayensis]|uniref:Ceramidase n=1 Tax=Pyxidicoccus parkwayensis TaxID=2813578 RepID=A0ABX7PAJ6_9BACT|nr:ceramidase [Pyxidicoccus parkwaysis]QSQ27549.1 ceramidase [Pyxidicoccus parkwaysis]